MSATHHVIVGASIAGVTAAMAMRNHGFEGAITVVDGDPHRPYERPPLSKMAAGSLTPLFEDDAYDNHGIELVLGTSVSTLDVGKRRISLSDGTNLPADAVLLATGVSARTLGVPGEQLRNVLTLRTADDAAHVFDGFAAGGPLVVIGGGFIGLEAAAVARSLGMEVTVVEVDDAPLIRPLGARISSLMTQLHLDHGVRIITNASAAAFHGTDDVAEVELTTGERLPAAMVIVGCGVVPNDQLAAAAGVYCDGGVVVDDTGRTSNPWVWAAGDVANQLHPAVGKRARIEHWDVALRHGTSVGASMAGAPTTNTELPYFWSDQYDLTLQMYGRPRLGDDVVLRADSTQNRFVAFWMRRDQVVAVAGIGDPKAVRAGKSLIESRVRVDEAALADPTTNLRSLTKQLTKSA